LSKFQIYHPLLSGEGHEASEEENSGDEEATEEGGGRGRPAAKKRGKKTTKKSEVNKVFARGGFGGAGADWQQDLDSEQRDRLQQKEKKKAEDIWAGRSPIISNVVVDPHLSRCGSESGSGSRLF